MLQIQPQSKVGDLVAENPQLGIVFERLGIDYCCGGKRSLEDACKETELDVSTLIQTLESSGTKAQDERVDPATMTLTELIAHIIETHHDYLREAIPQLSAMIGKVVQKHGERNARLQALPQLMQEFTSEIMAHMMKEERMLFPAIQQLEKAQSAVRLPFGSIANPIGVMESEHDRAGEALVQFRDLTDNYTVPEWGCNTYRSMVSELQHLELDMHQHIHKENNILFPRAIELENSLS